MLLHPVATVLTRRTCEGAGTQEDRSSDAAISHGMPGVLAATGRQEKDLEQAPPQGLQKEPTLPHLHFRLPASRTVRE